MTLHICYYIHYTCPFAAIYFMHVLIHTYPHILPLQCTSSMETIELLLAVVVGNEHPLTYSSQGCMCVVKLPVGTTARNNRLSLGLGCMHAMTKCLL